jgi:putative sigma-54 modulation protein
MIMRINIQTKGFELTDGLRQHTERRLHFAIDWASDEIRAVKVRFSDINGPRGGNDKRCIIQIPIAGQRDVVVEDTEADLYVAIDRAADRIERTLARKLERLREHKHQRLSMVDIEDAQDHAAIAVTPMRLTGS